MSRRPVVAAGLVALLALSGCQTWQDKADAKALAECATIADADARKACQTEVMAEASAAEARIDERQRELDAAQEERERLNKVYGNPE